MPLIPPVPVVTVAPRSSPPASITVLATLVFHAVVTLRMPSVSAVPMTPTSVIKPVTLRIPPSARSSELSAKLISVLIVPKPTSASLVRAWTAPAPVMVPPWRRLVSMRVPPRRLRLPAAATVAMPEMSVRAFQMLLPLMLAVPFMLKSEP